MICISSGCGPLLLAGARYDAVGAGFFAARAGLLLITFDLASPAPFAGNRGYVADPCPCIVIRKIIIHLWG